MTQEKKPLGAHRLLAIPAFPHHNVGFLTTSEQLTVYKTTTKGTLNEVWLLQTATYDLEGRQATFSAEPHDLDTSGNVPILLQKADDAGVKLSRFAGFVEREALVRHLDLRADRTFQPQKVRRVLLARSPGFRIAELRASVLVEFKSCTRRQPFSDERPIACLLLQPFSFVEVYSKCNKDVLKNRDLCCGKWTAVV